MAHCAKGNVAPSQFPPARFVDCMGRSLSLRCDDMQNLAAERPVRCKMDASQQRATSNEGMNMEDRITMQQKLPLQDTSSRTLGALAAVAAASCARNTRLGKVGRTLACIEGSLQPFSRSWRWRQLFAMMPVVKKWGYIGIQVYQ